MAKTITIAFVGAGNMADQHCKVLSNMPDVSLVGVTSRTQQRSEVLAARYGIARVFNSVGEMFTATRADLVVITVKELGLLQAVREAAEHEWTIFLEKPAGYQLGVARDIRDLLATKLRRAFVGLNRRHYAATLRAHEELAGAKGPRHILVLDQQSCEGARQIGHPEEVVRHFMYANSIHTIDYLRAFGRGEIHKVVPDREWQGEETFVHGANVVFSSGDIGRYEALWKGPGPWACFVTTPEVRLEMRPLEQLYMQKRGERHPIKLELDPIDVKYKPGFFRQAEQLLRAVRGEPDSRTVDINESFEVMELIHSIYRV